MADRSLKPHPHADATYVVEPVPEGFGVQVNVPGSYPAIVKGFATEAAAQDWVITHNAHVLAPPVQRGWRRR